MAKQEIRTVNGNQYLYYTHYENGNRIIIYCGPANHTKSKIKSTKLELDHTMSEIKRLEKKYKKLQNTLSRLCAVDATKNPRRTKTKRTARKRSKPDNGKRKN